MGDSLPTLDREGVGRHANHWPRRGNLFGQSRYQAVPGSRESTLVQKFEDLVDMQRVRRLGKYVNRIRCPRFNGILARTVRLGFRLNGLVGCPDFSDFKQASAKGCFKNRKYVIPCRGWVCLLHKWPPR
jgi:hypothetical protein